MAFEHADSYNNPHYVPAHISIAAAAERKSPTVLEIYPLESLAQTLWNKGGAAFCRRRHGGLVKTKSWTKSVSWYLCHLTLFFFSPPSPAMPRVCNQKINERRFCEKWLLSDGDSPRPASEREADSVSPARPPGPPHWEFRETLLFVHFFLQHKQFITQWTFIVSLDDSH